MQKLVGYPCSTRRPELKTRGFTLLEMLAAIVVMSVAVSIFFQLFVSALNLKESGSKAQSASRVAESRITAIKADPSAYEWPRYEEAAPGTLLPLYPKGQSSHVSQVEQPSEKPTDRRSAERTAAHFTDLTSESYTSLPSAESNHALVVVLVTWFVDGRKESFSLTTAVPRSVTEG